MRSACAAGGVLGLRLVTGCGRETTDSPAPAAPVAVQLGEPVHESSPIVAAEKYFARKVGELTMGRYQVEVNAGGALGADSRVTEMVRTGRVAFCKTLLANLTAYDKRLGVANLPYAFSGREQCLESLNGELGRRCAAILEEHDLVVIAYFYAGDRHFYNHLRPVHTPADLKGMRIRAPQNIVSIDMINALGADAVPLATNDITSALQQQLIDGAENSVVFYVTEQHVSFAPHLSWTGHQQAVDVLLGSGSWLAGLPAADREAILEAGRLTQVEQVRLWNAATADHIARAKKLGAVPGDADIPAFRKALASVLRTQRGTFGDLATLLPETD